MENLTLLLLSVLVITYAIYFSKKLYQLIKEKKINTIWLILFYLIFFLLAGYTIYAYIITFINLQLSAIKVIITGIFFMVLLFIVSIQVISQLQKQSHHLTIIKQRLYLQTKQLEQSNKIKDLIISVLDHDLKNPLSSIQGFAELGIAKTKNKELAIYLNKIRTNAKRMTGLISDMRTYSMIESFEKKKEQLDVTTLLKETITSFILKASEKNITIQCDITKQHIILAHAMLAEVFHNLIDNAIKYSQPGKKLIITATEEKTTLTFHFKDQGKGIPKKYHQLIFKRFERVGAKKAIEGTGLGLAICKHIVELHKGTIWVENNPEGGTIFKVKLPKK